MGRPWNRPLFLGLAILALAVATVTGGVLVDQQRSKSVTVSAGSPNSPVPGFAPVPSEPVPTVTVPPPPTTVSAPTTPPHTVPRHTPRPTRPPPAVPVTRAARYYLSLGDSFAAGAGAPSGQGYTDHITTHEAARLPGLVHANLACSDLTTSSLLNGGPCAYPQGSQLAAAEAFLTANPGQVAFITIDIGFNDVRFCFSESGGVDATCAQNTLVTAQANLNQILAGLRSAGGQVPIFGMNLYAPFLTFWLSGETAAAIQWEQFAVTTNTALASVYQRYGAPVADVQTAFDTTDFAMTGTYQGMAVPQNVANICAWTLMCPSGNAHPNAAGYQVIANAFQPLIDAAVSN